jgi:sugar lactone lactonase YvrE
VARGEAGTGTLMLLDLNLAEPAPRAALTYDPPDFRPHGISRLARAGEPDRLFAISHRADGSHAVELFEQGSSGTFFPRETLRDAAFVHPNALAAVGPREFYLVNDTESSEPEPRFVDVMLQRGHGTLVYFDGQQARVVAADLAFPAGIAVSADGSRLYIGEALASRLRIYRRDARNGALALDEVVPLQTAPDNINIDADGVLWIAAHPRLLAFQSHVRDPAKRAPTQVLRFDPRGPKPAGGAPDLRLAQILTDGGSRDLRRHGGRALAQSTPGRRVARPKGAHLQDESVKVPPPARALRPGALLVSGIINIGGALIVLFAMGGATDARHASTWVLVQFLSGVWAGVLGANSPFLHGLVAGLPALVLGLVIASVLPMHFVAMAWFVAPAAALIAAAIMRFMRHRKP